ncbi:MAG: PLP-dependent aminotransferase family protein, partial [Chloroflexota bacterium]
HDESLDLSLDEIIITAGSSGGLDSILRLFTSPGDTVLVEAPSYHEALALIRDHPVQIQQVATDAQGPIIESFEHQIHWAKRKKSAPVLFYTIPVFQNPSGVTWSLKRREEILTLSRQHDVTLIEDDVYRDLYYSSPPPPSLFTLDDTRRQVLRLGSFSKILSPGLRLGWLLGPANSLERITNCGLLSSGGGVNPFAAQVANEFCRKGWMPEHVHTLCNQYGSRYRVMLAALNEFMPPDVTWNEPSGGFFIWLTLPEGVSSSVILEQTLKEGVAFLSGHHFFATGGGERNIRLPFSYVQPEDMRYAIEVLGQVIRANL